MSLTRTLLTRQFPALATRTTTARTFSLAARRMAEGDAGATRSGGAAQGDAFTKREQASEDYYVRQQEKDKLAKLKQKIADQEAQLAKDREEAEGMVKKP
ncbi:ATPase inhibitor [Friedmanniomyces endolithicus]|uniref:ATPase inhibitor, mitochondrial n=1 Tax=Friedmanniomyces endolithicus TaxID=329885 RepID=A0AAN6KHI8_9PEZI|nr:ATPase inhibitor [Friedmanniomyces endolithicus]KAK0768834.1 ATPase inhibitor [Friedmanniomyces endolithicus]KAK0792025.1 ATPase inhibitor [Friedmanniomyces endolithicus]KAK0800487.1 ATPase inhibitor [Friedmanniomyces endolithicus]KAK0846631.1 ATPase inhibitor [Friedmanniomyces endolithicus]